MFECCFALHFTSLWIKAKDPHSTILWTNNHELIIRCYEHTSPFRPLHKVICLFIHFNLEKVLWIFAIHNVQRSRTHQFTFAKAPASDCGIIRAGKYQISTDCQSPDFISPCIVGTIVTFHIASDIGWLCWRPFFNPVTLLWSIECFCYAWNLNFKYFRTKSPDKKFVFNIVNRSDRRIVRVQLEFT